MSARVAPGLPEAIRLQRDLYLYWSAVARAGGVGLTSRGYVPRPALRRLREDLDAGAPPMRAMDEAGDAGGDATEADLPRLLFIRRALERLGLLRVSGGGQPRLEAAETRLMARYLARPLAERSRMLVRLWMGGAWWPDRPDPRAELPGLLAPAAPRVAIARRRLIEEIASLTPGQAAPALGSLRPARSAATSSHARGAHRRAAPRLPVRTTTAPGDAATPAALAGPLTWLGVVVWDAAAGEWLAGLPSHALREGQAEGRPDAAELAELPELPEAHGRVVAQSDLSVIAYPPFSGPELLTLDLCASREALSQTARYRLTRAALGGARDFGWDAAEVARRLERLLGASPASPASPTSSGALPDALRVTLSDWERLASRLRVEEGITLLETSTPEMMDALLADRASAGWGMRRLTPTAATIAPEAAPSARAWLLRHGALPAMSQEADES